jgi:hypothetical protein
MDLAETGSAESARRRLETELRRTRRNACQVLAATANACWVGVHPGPDGDPCKILEVPEGLHTLTNLRGLDELDHRGALEALDLPRGADLEEAVPLFFSALGTHADSGPDDPDVLCKHGEDRGTLSSSVLALPDPASGEAPRWWFAAGAPCETEFLPVGEDP